MFPLHVHTAIGGDAAVLTLARRAVAIAVCASFVLGGAAIAAETINVGYAVPGQIAAVTPRTVPQPAPANPSRARSPSAPSAAGPLPRELIVPDLVAMARTGITAAQVTILGKLTAVRAVLSVDGAQVTINGERATVLGVAPQAFRSWTPPVTAADTSFWTELGNGELAASNAAATRLGLTAGHVYQVSGAARVSVRFAAAAVLGLAGVDAIVDPRQAAHLGLADNVAVLINAPGADLAALMRQVQSIIGPQGRVINLLPVVTESQLPVVTNVPAGRPTSYLALYQDSAAQYCPGLSWTVLAAIGEIESGDGADDGPSTAGALGPMQFLPSTWRVWGTDAFGQTGPPDVMNALDAVPSAARMLCADGAPGGGASLAAAIFDYSHADWYVSEVLALADEYAQEYP